MTAEHKEPNYMGVFWALLVLTLAEVGVFWLQPPRLVLRPIVPAARKMIQRGT